MFKSWTSGTCAALLVATSALGQQPTNREPDIPDGSSTTAAGGVTPADRVLQSLGDTQLRSLVSEVLVRNPGVASAAAAARAAELRAPQVKALPNPEAGVTAWVDRPETRTGPQLLTLSWMQPLPWLSKFDLQEQAALLEAEAAQAEVEAARLELVTSVRRLYYELAFLVQYRENTYDFLDHLRQHEEISRSRYATGAGVSQDVVKIQAEITMAEKLLLDIDQRRVQLESEINRLRDRPPTALILPALLPRGEELPADFAQLLALALEQRPELRAVDRRIGATKVRFDLAKKQYRPDFKVGLTYTFVDDRQDMAGVTNPPEGNGDDILGIQGGVSIPLWRSKLRAGANAATEHEQSAREEHRAIVAEIETEIGDLVQRIPLTWQQLRLLEDVLIVQAEESVRSAQSGYVSGTRNALDLLDAEHVLYEALTAIARARADYAIRLSELEGEIGGPLEAGSAGEVKESRSS